MFYSKVKKYAIGMTLCVLVIIYLKVFMFHVQNKAGLNQTTY